MLKTRWQAMVKELSEDDGGGVGFSKRIERDPQDASVRRNPRTECPILKSQERIKFIGVKGANFAEYKIKVPGDRRIYSIAGTRFGQER
jgi:hypothetical protein